MPKMKKSGVALPAAAGPATPVAVVPVKVPSLHAEVVLGTTVLQGPAAALASVR